MYGSVTGLLIQAQPTMPNTTIHCKFRSFSVDSRFSLNNPPVVEGDTVISMFQPSISHNDISLPTSVPKTTCTTMPTTRRQGAVAERKIQPTEQVETKRKRLTSSTQKGKHETTRKKMKLESTTRSQMMRKITSRNIN